MRHHISRFCLRLAPIAVMIAAAPIAVAGPAYCASAGSGHPEICLRFDNFANVTPQPGTDFVLDFSDPDAPSVDLKRGRIGGTLIQWRIWCHNADNQPAPIGDIKTTAEYDFAVHLLAPGLEPAASQVNSIVLAPSGDFFSSVVPDAQETPSVIGGDFNGTIYVQPKQDGTGGILNLVVVGDVGENAVISAWSARNLIIGWDGYGDVTGTFAGTLDLYNGVQSDGGVIMAYLDQAGTIDLHGGDVHGALWLLDGGAGVIANGGTISAPELGHVLLGSAGMLVEFSGSATFASIGELGTIDADDLSGTIHITGDVNGRIMLFDLIDHARIKIDGGISSLDASAPTIWFNSIGSDAAITVDFNGYDAQDRWNDCAAVWAGQGGEREQCRHDFEVCGCPQDLDCVPCARVWETTSCVGDINNNGTVNPFDIDGFVAGLTSPGTYEAMYPGLEGSRTYHGDANCNGTFNTFDINDFMARVADGCCDCGGCGFMMSGGSGGPGGYTPIEAAALFKTYVDPALLDGWETTLGGLVGASTGEQAEYWGDVLKHMQADE